MNWIETKIGMPPFDVDVLGWFEEKPYRYPGASNMRVTKCYDGNARLDLWIPELADRPEYKGVRPVWVTDVPKYWMHLPEEPK